MNADRDNALDFVGGFLRGLLATGISGWFLFRQRHNCL